MSSTEPRTAVVNVLVVKPLQISEPDWCRGHRDDRADFKADISHDGPEHVIAPNGREMFRACLTQAPYSSVDRRIGLSVEVADLTGTHTPDEVEEFAAGLEAAATELRALGRELARLLDGGEGR